MYKLLLKSTFIISISFMPYYALSQDSTGIEEVVVTAEKRDKIYKMFHHQLLLFLILKLKELLIKICSIYRHLFQV